MRKKNRCGTTGRVRIRVAVSVRYRVRVRVKVRVRVRNHSASVFRILHVGNFPHSAYYPWLLARYSYRL